jgi:hypothetical protein
MQIYRRKQGGLAPLGWMLLSLTGSLHAGAIADSYLVLYMNFPAVVENQFGFSGPLPSLPPPTSSTTGDGLINQLVPSTVQTEQLEPRIIKATAGAIQVQTETDGTADAEETGGFSGNLANLTASPLTETFHFQLGSVAGTFVGCNDCDFANANIFVNFQIGDWTAAYVDSSSQNGPSVASGFMGGDVSVTIPASSVISYSVSWDLTADATSFCAEPVCDPTPNPPPDPPQTPEPGTLVLQAAGLAGLIWWRRRFRLPASVSFSPAPHTP